VHRHRDGHRRPLITEDRRSTFNPSSINNRVTGSLLSDTVN
jgi:hypothetical protein